MAEACCFLIGRVRAIGLQYKSREIISVFIVRRQEIFGTDRKRLFIMRVSIID